MDNKELLQEVQTEMYNHLTPYGEYKNGWYEVVTPDREQQSKICAQIAQLHYEPILQAKNTTIKELEAELERVKGLLKEQFLDYLYGNTTTKSEDYEKRWQSYAKENNITS